MSNRFYAHPAQRARSARLVLVAAALFGLALLPGFTAAAQAGSGARIAATLFQIDAPQPYSVLTNGASVAITGWTSGTQVDLYLDGPAGVGTGIGSVQVHGARPDVASTMGAELAYSGFEVPFVPETLASGEHMLFAYSLIDGAWSLQTIPIIGAGNVLPTERAADGDDMGVSNTAPESAPGVSSSAPAGPDSGVDSAPGEGDDSATL